MIGVMRHSLGLVSRLLHYQGSPHQCQLQHRVMLGEKGEKSARCYQTCLGLSGEEIKLRGSWAWLAALGNDKRFDLVLSCVLPAPDRLIITSLEALPM